jgi:hypothetical protein
MFPSYKDMEASARAKTYVGGNIRLSLVLPNPSDYERRRVANTIDRQFAKPKFNMYVKGTIWEKGIRKGTSPTN